MKDNGLPSKWSWWWNEEAQKVIKAKKVYYEELEKYRNEVKRNIS